MDVGTETEREIGNLIHRFYWLVDHGRAAETAEMFSEDALLTYGAGAPTPGDLRGEAVRLAMRRRQEMTGLVTRHVVSNLMLTRRGEDRVDSALLLTVFRSEEPSRNPVPHTVADVEESFVRDAGRWRIERRTISPVFVRD
ncbi:nuclear transport factor 2 family protein [Rhizorhabdus wittichii]|uniref:Nuclear transport factor 2 family protein n=1 Tax=Rhizorhabdus wittichii TaxID=160791 RepID=A0A975HC64_9SPHN|nr:nuclear transport factor 2 family protein [Rhizorhabdus wittichii]QTH20115.1 nuclear transport factor 2 family protein [Rhizorhabdus wittichii]